MTDETMIQTSLDAINSLIELMVKHQRSCKAPGENLVSSEQVDAFKLSVVQLLDSVRHTLSRLRVLPYFRVSLKFYSKAFAIEKPDCSLLDKESKCQPGPTH